jgi:hypothetical protein
MGVDLDKLNSIVERASNIIQLDPRMNEPNTKAKIIQPLIEALGWDVYGEEVKLEYPIRLGTSVAKVDYALMLEGKPVLFIEAKGFDSDIGESEATQVISYGRIDGVKWVAVTNGKELHIFNTAWGKTPDECLIEKIDVSDFLKKLNTLNLLSRDSIISGEIEEAVKTLKEKKESIQRLEQNKGKISAEISEVIKKYVGKHQYDKVYDFTLDLVTELIGKLKTEKIVGTPKEPPKKVLRKNLLNELQEGEVAVFPARPEGVEFLLKYQAWEFVRLNRRPKYLALYISSPVSGISYLGEIRSITKPIENLADIKEIAPTDADTFVPGKQVVFLKLGSIREFEDPIPAGKKGSVPYGLRYTTLEKIVSASRTDELW